MNVIKFKYFCYKKNMLVLGITGTIGAGKGTVVEYLIEKCNFRHYSVRGFLIEEINKQKLPVNRDSMVIVANELRALHGPAYIVEKLYEKALKNGHDAIIESIRTPGEIDLLKSKEKFYLIAVDAPAELRYKRIVSRNSETDKIDFSTFLENEKREMTTSDAHKQNLSKCIQLADVRLLNNKDLSFLHLQIDNFLKQIQI